MEINGLKTGLAKTRVFQKVQKPRSKTHLRKTHKNPKKNPFEGVDEDSIQLNCYPKFLTHFLSIQKLIFVTLIDPA